MQDDKNQRTRDSFFSSPSWLENNIAFFSIKRLVFLSILSVVIAFILLVSVFTIETYVIATHQKSIADRVLPSIAASRDVQKSLSFIESLKRQITNSNVSSLTTVEKRIKLVVDMAYAKVNHFNQVIGNDENLTQAHQVFSSNIKEVEISLRNILSYKKNILTNAPADQKKELRLKIDTEIRSIDRYLKEISNQANLLSTVSEAQTISALKDLGFVTSWSGWVLVSSIGLLMFILIILMATVLRKVNRPIELLNMAMHKLSGGDFSSRLPQNFAVPAEFKSLWADFNNFAYKTENLVNEQQIILDNAEIGIAWLRNRKFLRVNNKFLAVFDALTEDLVGMSTEIIFSEKKSFLHLVTHSEAVLAQGGTFTKEYKMKRLVGGEFWCKVSGKSTGGGSSAGSVWLFEDVTERKLAEQELQTMANYDSLTNLPNRSMFNIFVDQAIERSKRNKTEFAIFFIDLDRFKHINDSQGHDAGDFVLREVASRMQGVVRKSDVVARLGGDEFTIIIDAIYSRPSVEIIARNLLTQLRRVMIYDNKEFFVGGSIGISIYPEHGETRSVLMSNADTAMYVSKETGRNSYNFYNEKAGDKAGKFIELSQELRTAVREQEFELYYQPQIELSTNKII